MSNSVGASLPGAAPEIWRKSPVLIQVSPPLTKENAAGIAAWVGNDAEVRDGGLLIATLEGAHHASWGDRIVRGVKGEHYPVKPDIFAATYEPAKVVAEKATTQDGPPAREIRASLTTEGPKVANEADLLGAALEAGPVHELARFAEGDTRPVPQTYMTAGEAGPSLPDGPYRVDRVGIAPYSGPFTWGVIRAPEATFTAIAATQQDAEKVRDALNCFGTWGGTWGIRPER